MILLHFSKHEWLEGGGGGRRGMPVQVLRGETQPWQHYCLSLKVLFRVAGMNTTSIL